MKVARGHILFGQGEGGNPWSPPFNDSLAQFGQNLAKLARRILKSLPELKGVQNGSAPPPIPLTKL